MVADGEPGAPGKIRDISPCRILCTAGEEERQRGPPFGPYVLCPTRGAECIILTRTPCGLYSDPHSTDEDMEAEGEGRMDMKSAIWKVAGLCDTKPLPSLHRAASGGACSFFSSTKSRIKCPGRGAQSEEPCQLTGQRSCSWCLLCLEA